MIERVLRILAHKKNLRMVNKRLRNISNMTMAEIEESKRILELEMANISGIDIFADSFNMECLQSSKEMDNLINENLNLLSNDLHCINEANNLHHGFEDHNHNHNHSMF